MNRLLVIAYYTPPLGLSGVMRITKLCKFLPDYGWQPVILTVKPVAYYAYDPKLLADLNRVQIYRTESLDLNRLLRIFVKTGQRKIGSSAAGTGRLLNFILFPDAKIGWLPFAISAGKKIIAELKPQAVFATAPPWTALLIGAQLAGYAGLPFIADFRDPWPAGFQTPPFYQQSALKKLLKNILTAAELVLTVNPGTAARLATVTTGKNAHLKKIKILENGFDPEDLMVQPEKLEGFSILYAGNLYENLAQIKGFIKALSLVPEAKFYLAGEVDQKSRKMLSSHPQVVLLGRVTHSRVWALMKGADLLLYIGKPEQPVGLKLYEYLGANRPILIWGDNEFEATELIKEFAAGRRCNDAESLLNFIQEIKQNPNRFCEKDKTRLNRRFQAEWLAQQLDQIINSGNC